MSSTPVAGIGPVFEACPSTVGRLRVSASRRGQADVRLVVGEPAQDVDDDMGRAGIVEDRDAAIGPDLGEYRVGHGLSSTEVEVGGERTSRACRPHGEIRRRGRFGHRDVQCNGAHAGRRDAATADDDHRGLDACSDLADA